MIWLMKVMFPTEENNYVIEITIEKEITSKKLKIEILWEL